MAQATANKREHQAPAQNFHGSFCWNELMTLDVERAKKFYADAIGWSYEGMPMDWGTYWIIKEGDKKVGGMVEMKESCPGIAGDAWISYLAVDDVDARLKKAVASGAKAMREPFDVPNVGRIAILREPGGAVTGWMTPDPRMS